MGKYEELQQIIGSFEVDFRKFYEKQNKAAGTRVRKHMGELKKFAQTIRQEVQELKLKMKEEGK
ncbi:MAG TPA: histone H1 [Candidatus Kryptonia bacterium]